MVRLPAVPVRGGGCGRPTRPTSRSWTFTASCATSSTTTAGKTSSPSTAYSTWPPKPVEPDAETGADKNAAPDAELISVHPPGARCRGAAHAGAATSAKVEADFAGTGSTYFLLRLRQAYARFTWAKSDLLIGQTWHPLYATLSPTVVSLNTGAPFQPLQPQPASALRLPPRRRVEAHGGGGLPDAVFLARAPTRPTPRPPSPRPCS